MKKIVLGHYSPKALREVEEVDVTLDLCSAPTRYSWLFPQKVNCTHRSMNLPMFLKCALNILADKRNIPTH